MMTDEKENTDNGIDELEGVYIPADETSEPAPSPEHGGEFDKELADVIGGMTVMLFGVAEKARGAHWHIEQEQGLEYGKTCAIWYQKQFGDTELSPGWALFGASAALLLVPVLGEIDIAGKNKKPDQDKKEDGQEPKT